MKKTAMTIIGVAFMGMMALAQNDSTNLRDNSIDFNNQRQDPNLDQSTNPQYLDSMQRTQSPSSPIVQPLPQQQPQPQLETQPQLQTEPQNQTQPSPQTQPNIQTEPQPTSPEVPSRSQPILERGDPAQQNQLDQPVQPAQPVQPSLTIPQRERPSK